MSPSPKAPEAFADLLRARAMLRPETLAYRFLVGDSLPAVELSYGDLLERAGRIASALTSRVAAGDRVLLLCATGPDYVIAFHACQLLGAIAVPAYPPRGNRHAARVEQIVRDCEPACVLTDVEHFAAASRTLGEPGADAAGAPWVVSIDALKAEPAAPLPERPTHPVAFLQYTSGSTGAPKGVVITQANLFANLRVISRKFEVDDSYRTVFWLPPYHDMGLVGGVLHPVFGGYPVTLMSPFFFVQSPVRWLQSLSAEGATASAAPNFAYQACVDRITDEQCEGLDLSRWRIAICGGERVSRKTMTAFSEKFAPYGFDARALYPTYGMAEATLLMTGGVKGAGLGAPVALPTSPASAAIPVDDVVSCGTPAEGHELLIVDPELGTPLAEGEIGEIRFAGPSVAEGYRHRPIDEFASPVQGRNGCFLRTGDLGTLVAGELYVLGRSKEMIIVRGANFYPMDLEQAVADAHPAIAASPVAAFAAQRDGVEGVVLAVEIRRDSRRADPEEIRRAMTRALIEAHDIRPLDIVVVPPAGVWRTSSGKIRRFEMGAAYANGTLASHAASSGEAPVGPISP